MSHHVDVAAAAGIVLSVSSLAGSALAAPPTDEQRFERLAERIEAARVEHHVPGAALAVVRGDDVVFARGFGLANLEEQLPVTPKTIFAVGSTTKAFTSAVVGMLVDDERMTWDDEVTRWLPEFTPAIDGAEGDALLLRDALCHRSGFTRMSLLFVSGDVPRAEMLRVARGAEPYAPFRERFLYNNIMYMAAGMCAGEAAGSSWETLVRERIFAALGMEDSCLTQAEVQADPRLALGYAWQEEGADWRHVPMRNIDEIGPAGSINSNVLDMAEWVRFQLGRGTYEEQVLLAEKTHAELWSPQITIAGDVKYGFGWMLRRWQGQRVVEHGGNIDGFAAQVSLLPDSDLGYVLLTNTGFSPLQAGSIGIVFDAMAGDWEVDTGESESESGLQEFEGVYIANYAHFEDERFTVSVSEDGKLTLDIPSQRTFALQAPGTDGRRPFADVPGLAATFDRDDAGVVRALQLYQGGLKFDVPREGRIDAVEIPLDQLEKYTGEYHFAAMNADVSVLVKNDHLAVDVPNQMTFELLPPDPDGKWQFRSNDVLKIAVAFQEGEFGRVEAMTMFQSGQEFVLPRTADPNDAELPSLETVITTARLDERQAALEAATDIRLTASAHFAQSGIRGSAVLVFDARARSRADLDLGRFGSMTTVVAGDRGWLDFSFAPFDELSGRALDAARLDHPALFLGDWRAFHDEIRVHGLDEVDGTAVVVLKVVHGDLPGRTLYLDAATGDALRIDSVTEVPELGNARLPVTTHLRDWREIEGLRIPHELTIETTQNGRLIMTIESVDVSVESAPELFTTERTEA